MYRPRQNLLINVIITFSFNNCFRHSYSKMCKNVTDSGRQNCSDASISSFERHKLSLYECGKLYMHHFLLKLKKMTTFDDATARRTVMNVCVEGEMQPYKH